MKALATELGEGATELRGDANIIKENAVQLSKRAISEATSYIGDSVSAALERNSIDLVNGNLDDFFRF